MINTDPELARVRALIAQLDTVAQHRVHMTAQILRDLINDEEQGYECELALTLVFVERTSPAE